MSRRSLFASLLAFAAGCGSSTGDAPLDAAPDTSAPDAATDGTLGDAAPDGDAIVSADADAASPGDAADDVIAVTDGGTTGWTWRPVGGPAYPMTRYAAVASGDELLLLETGGRTFRRTGTSWTNIGANLPLGGGAASARPAGGFLETRGASLWTSSAGAWSRLADCPDRKCGDGFPLELASGALLLVDASGIHRRAASGGAWTTVSTLATGAAAPSAAGSRVCAGGMVSTDDGVTWKSLASEIPDAGYSLVSAVATTKGIVVSTRNATSADTSLSLRSDSGTWTKPLPDVHPIALAASAARVFVTGTGGVLARSLDGGTTWTVKTGTSAIDLLAVSSSRVLAGNGTGDLLSSTDDGDTFAPIERPSARFVEAFTHRPTSTPELWVARFMAADGSHAARLAVSRSTDGGTNWTSLGECAAGGGFGDGPRATHPFLFTLPSSLDVVGGGDLKMQRYDAATSAWVDFGTAIGGPLVASETRLLAWGSGALSTDLGATWGPKASALAGGGGGFDDTGRAWSFSNAKATTIASSASGTAWTTSTTGNLPPNSWSSFVARDGTLYATSAPMPYASPPATLMRSLDGGATWSPIATTSHPASTALLPIGTKSTLVLLLRNVDSLGDARIAVMVSTDGGSSFVDRTFDLPQAEPPASSGPPDRTTFFAAEDAIWASLPNYGLFKLVPTP